MQMKKVILFTGTAVLVLAGAAFTMQKKINWKINNNDTANLKFSFNGQQLKGTIKNVKGDIEFNKNDLASSFINYTFDVESLKAENIEREHQLSSHLFDAEKYPEIIFRSGKIENTDAGFVATGNLTIKNFTKEIKMPFTFEESKKAGFLKSTFNVKGSEYGIGESNTEPEDNITLFIEIPVEKN